MKIIGVLQGALLVALTRAEGICEKSIEKNWYHIYNTKVEVDVYYCSYTNEDDSHCKNSDNGEIQTDSPYLPKSCLNLFVQLNRQYNRQQRNATLCKIPARVNLSEDIITFRDNKSCRYSQRNCYDEDDSKYIFWTDTDICKRISFIHSNIFNAWTNVKDQRIFIQDSGQTTSLILTETFQFCGYNVRKTNYDGIIVSSKSLLFNSTISDKRQLSKLQSNMEEFCNSRNKRQISVVQQSATDLSKKWYIYKYPTDLTVHLCLMNSTKSCKDLNLGYLVSENSINLANQCKDHFCDSPACRHGNTKVEICRRTHQVDLEKNMLKDIEQCKYNESLCTSLNIFWHYTDRCGDITKLYEGYEENCGNSKCVIEDVNSTKLILSKTGILCGETIWYTDQHGLVASERDLRFSPSKTSSMLSSYRDETYEGEILKQDDEIVNLQNTLRYLLIVVFVCVLWYVFNVVVNLLSLRRLNKTRSSKEKVNLIYCLSQSLTAYYLNSTRRGKELEKVVPHVQASQLYVSVDNELYNKPAKQTI
ncbi:uncharacterized protein LOC108916321 isoform X2 [Anoplophora glabripennis]|uniref:uncharacterized protein LOC108916321 isoform X2 n=1 Tax=Anoplophora glabripennis TaxID=217634 RepID=UPI000874293B|nr:uncharacterized protein LOC108916321 isoform X2 [Anoplophora glabripennis]XP_018578055.1 uncharacterized protein LOC108916321 isoform X2 [Anoplophora glabripennis]